MRLNRAATATTRRFSFFLSFFFFFKHYVLKQRRTHAGGLPAGGCPAFSKGASLAPALDSCCTIVANLSQEAKRKAKFCRTAHFYSVESGRHGRKSLQNNSFWLSFWRRRKKKDKVKLKPKSGHILMSCRFSYYILQKITKKKKKDKGKTRVTCRHARTSAHTSCFVFGLWISCKLRRVLCDWLFSFHNIP